MLFNMCFVLWMQRRVKPRITLNCSYLCFIRSPSIVAADVFYLFFFWHFAVPYIQARWAYCLETLTNDWKCVHSDNVCPKILVEPPAKKFGGSCFFYI